MECEKNGRLGKSAEAVFVEALGWPTSRKQNRGAEALNSEVVIICPYKAYYYGFFVNLQSVRGNSIKSFNNTTGYEKTHSYTMLRFRLFFI